MRPDGEAPVDSRLAGDVLQQSPQQGRAAMNGCRSRSCTKRAARPRSSSSRIVIQRFQASSGTSARAEPPEANACVERGRRGYFHLIV